MLESIQKTISHFLPKHEVELPIGDMSGKQLVEKIKMSPNAADANIYVTALLVLSKQAIGESQRATFPSLGR